ncbi:sensor histidine kinase [Faunimonas sp. B44]|uniref:sensor histidine kinase n=1 Tax=Faunimonas sp. B44 TaxID=3461493 RepID=UPI004043FC21
MPTLVTEPRRTTQYAIERSHVLPELHARSPRYPTQGSEVLLQHRETLLREVHHRVGNSLQIIASILALDAQKVDSAEARLHLESARRRILAVAAVQQQLQNSREGGDLELAGYLRRLCEHLTASVVGDAARIVIEVRADAVAVSSATATSMGLIVTELVINALKHAFALDASTGRIVVTYRVEGRGWTLTVSDNGAGRPYGNSKPAAPSLGTSIVATLARQLGGQLKTARGGDGVGTAVSITSSLACPTQ